MNGTERKRIEGVKRMALPKKEIHDIQLRITDGLLGKEQYEFICLRLIDTIKQKDEEIERLKQKIPESQ